MIIQKKKISRYLTIVVVLLVGLMVSGCRQQDPQALAEEATRQAQWRETLLEYGYPEIVIEEMEPVLKEQICRDQVYFHSAEVRYMSSNHGEREVVLTYVGPSGHVEHPFREKEEPEYDFCGMLVTGICYVDGQLGGELEHILCSFLYRWENLPEDREEDELQITWDGDLLWSLDDSFWVSWSQITKEGRREGLGANNRAARVGRGTATSYTRFRYMDRFGVQGLAGAVWLQLRPLEGVDLTKDWPRIQGSYQYQCEKGWMNEYQAYDVSLDLRFFSGEEIYEGN